jgi:hypothetical protein
MNDEFPCTHQPGEQAMSTKLDRRAVLAATAALPAIALPATAAEPDPIFAVLSAHREAEAAVMQLSEAAAPWDEVGNLRWMPRLIGSTTRVCSARPPRPPLMVCVQLCSTP